MGMLYKVVKAKRSHDLENKVNLLIQEGWEPCGNLSVAITNRTKYHRAWARYAQAMVRRDENVSAQEPAAMPIMPNQK